MKRKRTLSLVRQGSDYVDFLDENIRNSHEIRFNIRQVRYPSDSEE